MRDAAASARQRWRALLPKRYAHSMLLKDRARRRRRYLSAFAARTRRATFAPTSHTITRAHAAQPAAMSSDAMSPVRRSMPLFRHAPLHAIQVRGRMPADIPVTIPRPPATP